MSLDFEHSHFTAKVLIMGKPVWIPFPESPAGDYLGKKLKLSRNQKVWVKLEKIIQGNGPKAKYFFVHFGSSGSRISGLPENSQWKSFYFLGRHEGEKVWAQGISHGSLVQTKLGTCLKTD